MRSPIWLLRLVQAIETVCQAGVSLLSGAGIGGIGGGGAGGGIGRVLHAEDLAAAADAYERDR